MKTRKKVRILKKRSKEKNKQKCIKHECAIEKESENREISGKVGYKMQ